MQSLPLHLLRRVLAPLAFVAANLLTACGGGSAAPSAPSDPPGGGNPQAGYSAEQRAEATARIAIRYEQLLEANHAAPWEALRAYAVDQPEFDDAGVGDGSLWARFTDGRVFVYTDNWRHVAMPTVQSAPADLAAPAAAPEAAPKHRLTAGLATGAATAIPAAAAAAPPAAEVPASARAVYLRLAPDEFSYADGLIQHMQAMLGARGWQHDSQRRLTIEHLKQLQGQGFVFLTSHAAAYGPDGAKRYGILTETASSDDMELAHQSDLADGSLIYGRDRSWMIREFGREFGLWGRSYPRYVATDTFVRKHVQLAANSLVVLMMCNSGSPEAAVMRQAFRDQGAGAVMVWDGSANPMGYPTVEALVDRMTGANRPVRRYAGVLAPTLVPQRAFERADVEPFLGRVGLLDQPATEGDGTTRIRFEGDRFALLNPVLVALRATGRDKLILHGRFGTRPEPTITVGGHPVAVDRWAPDGSEIEVTLPTGTDDPPGSKGEVIVTVQGRSSNVRVLGSWRGEIEYIHEEIYDVEPEVFRNRSKMKLHLRADAHAMRTEVDGPLLDNPYLISVASDTRLSWVAEGGCPQCHLFHSWSGSRDGVEAQYNIDSSSPYPPDITNMVNPVFAMIHATRGQLQLANGFGTQERFTVTEHHVPVRTFQEALRVPDITLLSPPLPPGQVGLMYAVTLPFAWQQDIAPQKLEHAEQSNPSSATYRHTVRWGSIAASPAFDDRTGR